MTNWFAPLGAFVVGAAISIAAVIGVLGAQTSAKNSAEASQNLVVYNAR